MNYIRLTSLTNTYPQTGNYIPFLYGNGALFGIYADVNKIDFEFYNFSEVIPIDGISTRFIFAVTYDKSLSDIIDSDQNLIESNIDIDNTQKSENNPVDTTLDKFIETSDSSKRKRKKGFLGRLARKAIDLVAGDLIDSVENTVSSINNTKDSIKAISFGIKRNEIRKRKKSKLSANSVKEDVESTKAKTPALNPLTKEPKEVDENMIGRKSQKRSRIFGNDISKIENSTSISKKEDLLTDSNLTKPRIFSDLKVENKDNIETKLFCSKLYLENLTDAKQSANPYFLNFSFKPEFIVEINSNALLEVMDSYLDAELTNGVLMKRNNYLVDGNIDYEKLLKYVDWVVSKPKLSEIDTDGVIPANLLCEYEKGTFDKKTGKWDVSLTQTSNTTVNETKPAETNNATFPPVGRAGTYTGEIVEVGGERYAWVNSTWRPNANRNIGIRAGGGGFGRIGGR